MSDAENDWHSPASRLSVEEGRPAILSTALIAPRDAASRFVLFAVHNPRRWVV